MSLGSRIQSLRKKHGFTQDEMAQLLGIQRSAFGHIENDRVEVGAAHLSKLATKLKTTPNYLLSYTDGTPYDPWISEIAQSPDYEVNALKEIWTAIKKMREDK